MDGFVALTTDLLLAAGVDRGCIAASRGVELPGWFRAEKAWDLLVVNQKRLVASIEFKSQVGSFGNNFNNRTEEALGSATDLWAAYREGAFQPSARPWLGYIMLLEEADRSMRPVRPREPHFSVFPEFQGTSYAQRYELLLLKLLRERLYDGARLILTSGKDGQDGGYREPNPELTFHRFAESLIGHASAAIQMRE